MEQLPDSSLIEFAKDGDQAAFAELYTRYFDPVYDFVARMTRNRDEAADIAQDTFLKAMNALGGLQKGASFKSWIFTIARNTALNRLEKSSRTRPLTYESEDGEEVGFDVVDSARFSDPEEAAQASAVASLVWEAAAGLDPKQLSLLDLHLRQGLDSGEIADVLGVTKNNGYVMLNRLKKAVEDSIGAFIMFKDGRQYCDDLDSVLKTADIRGMSPETRKVVEGHLAQCPNCEERKKKLAPLAAFAAFGAIGAPAGAKAHILEGLMQQWPGPVAPGAGANGGGANSGNPGGGSGSGGSGSGGGSSAAGEANGGSGGVFGKAKVLVPALGGLAALLFGALFLPQSPLALIKDNSDSVQVSPDPTLPAGEPTLPGNSPSGAPSATPTRTNTPSPSSTPNPVGTAQNQAGATATATKPLTSTQVPAATKAASTSTPTPTPTATATRTNTPIPTATRTNTPTITPTPVTPSPTVCVPILSASPDVLNIAPTGAGSFSVSNGTPCSASFSASPDVSWLSITGGGGLAPFSQKTVSVAVGRLPSAPGTYKGRVLVEWNGGSFPVSVTVVVQPPPNSPPVISSIVGSCSTATFGPQTNRFEATVSDNGTVASVQVLYSNVNGAARVISLTNAGGNLWLFDGVGEAKNGSNFRVVATDNLSASTTQAFTPGSSCFF